MKHDVTKPLDTDADEKHCVDRDKPKTRDSAMINFEDMPCVHLTVNYLVEGNTTTSNTCTVILLPDKVMGGPTKANLGTRLLHAPLCKLGDKTMTLGFHGEPPSLDDSFDM